MNPLGTLLVRLGLHASELPSVAREVARALAPHLNATARLTVRLDITTDGPGGPLPDPVVEVSQLVTVGPEGIELEGVPSIKVSANPAA